MSKERCFDQSSEFHNRSFKTWLGDHDIEMYSRFIIMLKNKVYWYMTAVSKVFSY